MYSTYVWGVWPKRGDDLCVNARSCFFSSLKYYCYNIHKRYLLQATFLYPAFFQREFDIKSLGNHPAVVFFIAARSLSKVRTIPMIRRSAEPPRTSSPQRIIYLSTRIKAPGEKYPRSCSGYLKDTITLQTNISIMKINMRQFCRNADRHRRGLWIGNSSAWGRQRPIVLGDTRPECPYRDNREKGE